MNCFLQRPSTPVGGRLAKYRQKWSKITNDPWILSTVQGFHIKFSQISTFAKPSSLPSPKSVNDQRAGCNFIRGDSILNGKICHNMSTFSPRARFLQQCLCGPKAGWGVETHYQPPEVERLHPLSTFQDGKYFQSEGHLATRRLASQDRFERCISDCPHGKGSSQIPSLPVARKDLRIQVPSLWSFPCTSSVHKVTPASSSLSSTAGCANGDILRRYPVDGGDTGVTAPSSSPYYVSVDRTGFSAEFEKVHPHTMQMAGVLGFHRRQSHILSVHSCGESSQDQKRLPTPTQQRESVWKGPSSYHWPLILNHTSCISGSSALSTSAASEVKGPTEVQSKKPRLRHHSAPQLGGKTGPDVVDKIFVPGRSTPQMVSTDSNDRVRCIKARLGCSSSTTAADSWRDLEPGRSKPPHQLARVEGCFHGAASFCVEPLQHSCPLANGQHSCYSILESFRRDQILPPMSASNFDLELVSAERNHSPCRSSTGTVKCEGRLCFQKLERLQRLDAGSSNIRSTSNEVWPVFNRPVCIKSKCSTHKFLQLESKSRCLGGRCPSSTVEPSKVSLCIPSLCLDREVPTENTGGESLSCAHHSSSLASSTLVPPTPTNADRLPSSYSESNRPSSQSSSSTSPTNPKRPSPIGRLASVRNSISSCKLSEDSLSIYNASWRKSTAKSYNCAWNLWTGWCHQRLIDPISAPLKDIIQFLTDQFHAGKQYSTLNTYRSTISSAHPPIDGVLVGKHPIVSRFMQGVFNSRPPCPKYSSTWDVDRVINYLHSLGPSENLSLKNLSMKLVVLMAFASANRSSDLHALDIKFRRYTPEGVIFILPSLTKTRRSGPPKESFYCRFEDEILCPVHTLQTYEKCTANLRLKESSENRLFISFRKPHKAVCSSSIARWMKSVLTSAGVDTDRLKLIPLEQLLPLPLKLLESL